MSHRTKTSLSVWIWSKWNQSLTYFFVMKSGSTVVAAVTSSWDEHRHRKRSLAAPQPEGTCPESIRALGPAPPCGGTLRRQRRDAAPPPEVPRPRIISRPRLYRWLPGLLHAAQMRVVRVGRSTRRRAGQVAGGAEARECVGGGGGGENEKQEDCATKRNERETGWRRWE